MAEQNQPTHHTVLALRVTGGFLGAVSLEFGPGLNCIIGGRGTGKTTALEFLRFALGLMPDARTNPGRARSMESLVKTNLAGGRVVVEVKTREGLRYRAERSPGEAPQVFNETGVAVPVSLDGDRIFGVDVFSQNEIEEIALSPPAQLDLLDRFVDGDAQLIERELRDLQEQVSQTTRELRRLDAEIDDLRASASEHVVLEEKMKGLAPLEGPDADALKVAQANKGARTREALLADRLNKAVTRAVDDVGGAHRAFAATLDAQLEADFRNGANKSVIAALDEDARFFVRVLEQATTLTSAAATRLTERLRIHQQALAQLHAAQEATYSKLIASSQEQGGRLAERAQAEERLAAALDAAKEAEAKRTERAAVSERLALPTRERIEQRGARRRDARLRRFEDLADERFSPLALLDVAVARVRERGDDTRIAAGAL